MRWTRWGWECGSLPQHFHAFPTRSSPRPAVQGSKEVSLHGKTDCQSNSHPIPEIVNPIPIPSLEGSCWVAGNSRLLVRLGLPQDSSRSLSSYISRTSNVLTTQEILKELNLRHKYGQRLNTRTLITPVTHEMTHFRISVSWAKDKDKIRISYCALVSNPLAFTGLLSVGSRRTHSSSHSEIEA